MAALIMLNNYLHDLAAGLLFSSALAVYVLNRRLGDNPSPEVVQYFRKVYGGMSKLVIISLVWIVLGGAVRTWAYQEFEWAPAVGRHQVTLLIFKHILFFSAVLGGGFWWYKLNQKVKRLTKS